MCKNGSQKYLMHFESGKKLKKGIISQELFDLPKFKCVFFFFFFFEFLRQFASGRSYYFSTQCYTFEHTRHAQFWFEVNHVSQINLFVTSIYWAFNLANNTYRLITAYLLLRVNLDKIMHARWDFDASSARTRRVSALDTHQNWSAGALFCLNSRAKSKYAVVNLIHTRRKQPFFVFHYVIIETLGFLCLNVRKVSLVAICAVI